MEGYQSNMKFVFYSSQEHDLLKLKNWKWRCKLLFLHCRLGIIGQVFLLNLIFSVLSVFDFCACLDRRNRSAVVPLVSQ